MRSKVSRETLERKAIARVRTKFKALCHASLDSYLSEADPETGLPTIDVLVAYMGQGWNISVGVNCSKPETKLDDAPPAPPQTLEERAAAAGIQIASA